MGLPFTRSRTYAAGSQVYSDDLNRIQDAVVLARRRDLEHFEQGPANLGVGTDYTSAGILATGKTYFIPSGAHAKVTLLNDNTDPAFGYAQMRSDDGSAVTCTLWGTPFLISAGIDFCMRAVVRVPDLTKLGSNGLYVVASEDIGAQYGFQAHATHTHWRIILPDGTINTAPTVQEAVKTTWQELLLIRESGVATWYVGGVEIYSMSENAAVKAMRAVSGQSASSIGSGTSYAEIDSQILEAGEE